MADLIGQFDIVGKGVEQGKPDSIDNTLLLQYPSFDFSAISGIYCLFESSNSSLLSVSSIQLTSGIIPALVLYVQSVARVTYVQLVS